MVTKRPPNICFSEFTSNDSYFLLNNLLDSEADISPLYLQESSYKHLHYIGIGPIMSSPGSRRDRGWTSSLAWVELMCVERRAKEPSDCKCAPRWTGQGMEEEGGFSVPGLGSWATGGSLTARGRGRWLGHRWSKACLGVAVKGAWPLHREGFA
jgi:hypothetical protein